MNHSRTGSGFIVLLTALAFVAVIGGCGGSEEETMPAASSVPYSASTPTAGLQACAICHTQQTADWLTTKHANLDPAGNLYSQGNPTIGQLQGAVCIGCHDPLQDSNNLTAGVTGNTPRPVVACEACHGPGSMHVQRGGIGPISLVSNTEPGTWGTGTVEVSAQFRMCTSCHELLDTSGTGTAAFVHDPTTSNPTPTGSQYVITDTHFAVGGDYTGDKGGNKILAVSGYAMNYASDTVCTDCHNPHKTADINREWAASGHAFRGPENPPDSYNPWSHYNWSCDIDANCGGYGAGGDRRACQRCHTASGFAAYAGALEAGNTALAQNIWSYGAITPYDPNFKPEMLECKGCHKDNKGTLRNPGAYTASYKVPIGGFPVTYPINASVSYQYPDLGASNVCMPCHTARGSGKAIHDLNTNSTYTVNFASTGYLDGHYLSGGGTMFRGTGYEYAGRNYADPDTFKHKQIGTSAQPGTGTKGPCIGCHMDRTGMPGNHLFEPVTAESGNMVVTSSVCFECHAGGSSGPGSLGDLVQGEKDNFESGLEALDQALIVSGYTFTAYGPPYFKNTDWLIFGDTDASGNSGGKNTMGAAFNYSLLHHEPGAYVHNSRYVKRLIYDSIDWIDDGQMNYSVGGTLNDACSSSPPAWCAGAKNYLLYGAKGTSAERP